MSRQTEVRTKKERKKFIKFTAGYVTFLIPVRMVDSFSTVNSESTPIPMAARSNEWVCGVWLAGIAGSNPTGGIDISLS